MDSVHVYPNIEEILTNRVDRNALAAKNVLGTKLAFAISVKIHVQVYAGKMPNVMSLTIYQVVHVLLIILEIHLFTVNQWKEKNPGLKTHAIHHLADQIVYVKL